ncbi:MAG: AMP-binding protein [Gammaproteobacteria bacterium]|nr:AMP-binding protein [Gammaproteobacteria bacterium]
MSQHHDPIQMLMRWAREKGDTPYLHQPTAAGVRVFTWSEVAAEVRRVAGALRRLQLPAGSRIALSGLNTAHWFIADLAVTMAGHVSVGLYPKQAGEAVRYIFEHSGARAVFVGPMPDAGQFLAAVPQGVLKIAMPYPGVGGCDRSWEALCAGAEPITDHTPPPPDRLTTLVYTSGTTGNPKGVMITAGNLGFVTRGLLKIMPARPQGEVFLSYLPLAHMFERGAVEMASLYLGAEVYFLESIEKLGEALRQVRPTRFFAVPLVWTRMQSQILKQVPQAKLDRLLAIPLVSALVKRKVKKQLGLDRSWLRISGAAPLPLPVLEWFSRLGIDIYQGYGMTENSIYISCNLPGANRPGSVGRPFPDAPTRISPEGEIQNKHPGITPGYYNDPKKTRELFTADGWLKTGDMGRLDSDGYLWITGRVKEIFKTLKGKYVAPSPIEGAFASNTDIDQLCFVGSGLPQPLMVVALNVDARAKPREQVAEGLITTMQAVNAELEPHEQIGKIVVVAEAWSIDNGLLTPTMKVKRNEVERRYAALLAEQVKSREPLAWID